MLLFPSNCIDSFKMNAPLELGNIYLNRFSRAVYIMLRGYNLSVRFNEIVAFRKACQDDDTKNLTCLSPDLVKQIGFEDGASTTQ